MQKRYIPILVILVISALIAGIGYFQPDESEQVPTRVLFDNTAGAVVFDHKVHAQKYKIDCIECHHDMATVGTKEEMESSILNCTACHGVDYNEEYIAQHEELFTNPFQCATCHHIQFDKTDWGHDFHAEEMAFDCTTCHHDEEIEPEPQNCADCHSTGYAPADDPMPSLKNAVHTRCMDCHADYYDEGLNGCQSCHTDVSSREKLTLDENFAMNTDQASCISCHEDATPNELIIGTMEAFHTSCMDCHEEVDKGPYKADQCSQCHL